MMGRQSSYEYKFFVEGFSLDKRIRKDHVLRRILEEVEFDFILEKSPQRSRSKEIRSGG